VGEWNVLKINQLPSLQNINVQLLGINAQATRRFAYINTTKFLSDYCNNDLRTAHDRRCEFHALHLCKATAHKNINVRKSVQGTVPRTAKYSINLFVSVKNVTQNGLTIYKNRGARGPHVQ
jgi:hypothetical protein